MPKSYVCTLLAASLIMVGVGCSAASKRSKGTTTATTSSPLFSSSKKVQADLNQTETDLGSLESEIKSYK